MRRLRSAALGLVLASLLSCQNVPATATPAPSGAQTGGIVRVAIPGEVTSLDPWNADDPSLVATRQIFETLVTVDAATGRIGPGLASSWQSSNDGASWTFTLHDGVRFHDGSSLDASAERVAALSRRVAASDHRFRHERHAGPGGRGARSSVGCRRDD